jgi:putative ABC transport system permease protein
MRGGETDANQARSRALARSRTRRCRRAEQFIDNQISGLNSVLNILYVLLALSVIVSLFGIVNTLVLTVFERTRELGMLRAIGMTRRQVRRMIRHESVITALIGACSGSRSGSCSARCSSRGRLHRVLAAVGDLADRVRVAAIVVGIVAAIFPARRARG